MTQLVISIKATFGNLLDVLGTLFKHGDIQRGVEAITVLRSAQDSIPEGKDVSCLETAYEIIQLIESSTAFPHTSSSSRLLKEKNQVDPSPD